MSDNYDQPKPFWAKVNAAFDNMPPAARERLAYSVYWDTSIPIDEEIKKAALEDFGPDHPQAQGLFCYPLRK